jgi:hypothetical protein
MLRRLATSLFVALAAVLGTSSLQAQREPIVICTYKLIYFEMWEDTGETIEVWQLEGCEVLN